MVPLLQSPLQNPHATLITLFLNTVNDNLTAQDKIQSVSMEGREMKSLFEFLPPNGCPIDGFETGVVKFSFAREIVGRYDHVFDRYNAESTIPLISGIMLILIKVHEEDWVRRGG